MIEKEFNRLLEGAAYLAHSLGVSRLADGTALSLGDTIELLFKQQEKRVKEKKLEFWKTLSEVYEQLKRLHGRVSGRERERVDVGPVESCRGRNRATSDERAEGAGGCDARGRRRHETTARVDGDVDGRLRLPSPEQAKGLDARCPGLSLSYLLTLLTKHTGWLTYHYFTI